MDISVQVRCFKVVCYLRISKHTDYSDDFTLCRLIPTTNEKGFEFTLNLD